MIASYEFFWSNCYQILTDIRADPVVDLLLRHTRSHLKSPLKVWGVIHYLLIILSIINVFVGTMKGCRVPRTIDIFVTSNNSATNNDTLNESSKIHRLRITQPHDVLRFLENGVMFIFTMDLILRLLVTPSLKKMFSGLYMFDLICLIPMYCRFIIDMVDYTVWHKDSGVQLSLAMDILMVFRALRMFMLARYYRGLRVLLLALKACLGELVLLMLFVLFSLTIYACCIYSAEVYNDLAFDNVFIGLYWGLITMATVGYGDIFPRTIFGYIVAVICAMTGVIIVGMVIPIFAGKFTLYYRYRDAGTGHLEKRCSKHVLPKETVRPAIGGGDLHKDIKLRVENCKNKSNIDIKTGRYPNDSNTNDNPTDNICADLGAKGYTGNISSWRDCV
ncbi:hypothetical protein CHS0354_041466 [Potamilus streckersoni]|uniref:Ion transport domain-containing protein n=1 Tax=Potamilus streckersoni TaxID=2493646 RepID=A0AAE0TAN4_9BIVA|nr:hypothetical protein CHS0354_041466 [Potamilus streckersoni]